MPKKYLIGLAILFILILGFAWYWYSFRPEQIRKNCYKFANNGMAQYVYKDCLLRAGIKD